MSGLIALACAIGVGAVEGRLAYEADVSMEQARKEVARAEAASETARRVMNRSADLLVATSSVESSPERILEDLRVVLPGGVQVVSLKVEYAPEGVARLDLGVVARGPEAYDRFLSALSKSPRFAEIRPGAESRPGPVRAAVALTHRPTEQGR